MTLNYKNILAISLLLVVIGVFSIIWQKPGNTLGSIRAGDQYQSTSTPQVADAANLCPARVGMASSTTGTLGSVNFLNANTGTITIYDATTTDNTKRISAATSSLILAEFPASPTEGSYHFDIEFIRGLLVDYSDTNTAGTTTISYRCES